MRSHVRVCVHSSETDGPCDPQTRTGSVAGGRTVQGYLLRIFDESRYFLRRITVGRYFGGSASTAEADAEGNRTPSFVPVEVPASGVGRLERYGPIPRHPRGSQRPSYLHGPSSGCLPKKRTLQDRLRDSLHDPRAWNRDQKPNTSRSSREIR